MNIVPNPLTINGLLSIPNEQFVIPSYQRRYAWKEPQVWALFEDIDMLQDGDGHLFGMLILHSSNPHHAGINQLDLVDGQQRLTTLSLLLLAILKKYKEEENEEKIADINKMLYCKDYNDKTFQKLILGDLDKF